MARALSQPVRLVSPEKGLDGRTTLAKARAPVITDGRIGDFWIDTAAKKLYGPKHAGGWPDNGLIKGDRGWTPVSASVPDGTRRVQQIIDWQGGEGTKPDTGQYVGDGGLVDDIEDATDNRGAPGPQAMINALDDGGDTVTYETLVSTALDGEDNKKQSLAEIFSAGGKMTVESIAAAQATRVPQRVKRLETQFYAPDYDVPATLVGGANYRRVNAEPAHAGKFRTLDRFLSDGSGTDSANGGWWEISEAVLSFEMFGAIGDDAADSTLAVQNAINATLPLKKKILVHAKLRVTAQISLVSGLELQGQGDKSEAGLRLDTTEAIAHLLNGEGVGGVKIAGVTLYGGLNDTHVGGSCVRLAAESHGNEISDCHFQNSPRESVLVRDGSDKNRIIGNTFDRQGGGAGHIYFLTDCEWNEASNNHFNDSAGGCIWLSGGVLHTTIIGNTSDRSDYELIGIRWDCNFGVVSQNRARLSGDNGISVTGSGWAVTANECFENDFAGIAVYGNDNTVTGNVLFDNGKAGGSLHGGLLIAPQFGGLAADNVIGGNQIFVRNGGATEQFYGVRISSTSYTVWASGVAVTPDSYRSHLNRLYVARGTGTTGATAPVHTSGDASDGSVTWRYIGAFKNSLRRAEGNRIGRNRIGPHLGGRIQRFGSASPQDFDEQDETAKRMRIKNAWAAGIAHAPGDVVHNVHSDNVPRYYRATTAGTSGAGAPTHTSGAVNDGGVTWYYLGEGDLNEVLVLTEQSVLFKAKLLIEAIDTTALPASVTVSTGNPENIISAPNGSVHLRVNTSAPGFYVKTGVSDTNTGWRNLLIAQPATAANIANAAHAVNTVYKQQGLAIYDSTNKRLLVADGGSATSAWWVSDGSSSVTPA